MTSSTAVYLLAILFAVCLSSAAATYDLDDDTGDFQDVERRSSYTEGNLEAALEAMSGILKSHALALRQLEATVYEQKRGGARSRQSSDDLSLVGVKRRTFWQPLGYLPASARVQNANPEPKKQENQDSGSTVFRYG